MGRAWRSSSRASTRSPEAGLAISSTAITRPFRIWIPGSGCVCAAFCVSVRSGAVGAEGAIISAGPMLSLPRRGCSLLHKPRRRCVNPLGGEPLTGEPDAGNPPVRFGGREERIQSPLPTPIKSGRRYASGTLDQSFLHFCDPIDERQAKAYRTSAAHKFISYMQGKRTRRDLWPYIRRLQTQRASGWLHVHPR